MSVKPIGVSSFSLLRNPHVADQYYLPRPIVSGVGHGEVNHTFSREITHRLEAFAKQIRVTVNTLVQASWALILSRYSGQRNVCFGATVAGRITGDLAGAEQLIGPLFNTLPVITSLHPEQRVRRMAA